MTKRKNNKQDLADLDHLLRRLDKLQGTADHLIDRLAALGNDVVNLNTQVIDVARQVIDQMPDGIVGEDEAPPVSDR